MRNFLTRMVHAVSAPIENRLLVLFHEVKKRRANTTEQVNSVKSSLTVPYFFWARRFRAVAASTCRCSHLQVLMEWVYYDKFNNVGTAPSAIRAEVRAEKHLRALRARKERREQRLGAAEDNLLRSSRYAALPDRLYMDVYSVAHVRCLRRVLA